jgi:elongation factor Ts
MDSLKQLRAQSGAPIVECKSALQNTEGDLQAAMDWLREHGAAKASSKVLGRETPEGLVGLMITPDHKTASLVQVAAETDFAGRSAKFVQLVGDIAVHATRSDFFDGPLESFSDDAQVRTLLDEAIVAIRENLSVVSAIKLEASLDENSILVGYVHNRVESSEAGSAAAVVEVSSETTDMETLQSVGKKLAMHIVAARPEYLSPEQVPEEEVNKSSETGWKIAMHLDARSSSIIQSVLRGFHLRL